MIKNETVELIGMLNDNEDKHVFTENDWVIKAVNEILTDYIIKTINIYGRKEIDTFKEDISSVGAEVVIDVDNKFTSARTSKIELYSKTDRQFLDFEVTNVVSFTYRGESIGIINDEKEKEDVLFNDNEEMLVLFTDYIYTSDRGLNAEKILDVYVPFNLTEILEEEADY